MIFVLNSQNTAQFNELSGTVGARQDFLHAGYPGYM